MPRAPERLAPPTKMAKASARGMLWAAATRAAANENTMPTFAQVRSRPAVRPKSLAGEARITALVLAGKNAPDPNPFTTLPADTTQSGVVTVRCV